MRNSNIYGVSVPELGDRADITVVSDAIVSNEDNQSGKVENMKATLNSTIIELTSECRTNKLLKYYNGLSIQFVSPVDINAGNSYNIKIDNLAEQPYNNKIDIKLGDVVVAIYGESGFVSYGTTLPRSSSVESNSEASIATSKAVKTAYDKGVEALGKANTKLDAGHVAEDYNTAEKIENKIKSSIELANTKLDKGSEDLKLSNAELIVKAIESNQGLKFDTILNIDDVGTKQEGYCYMFDGDIYKCIKQTEATTPESANFQPISNNKLSDRLDNLRRCQVDYIVESKTYTKGTVFNTDEILDNDIFIISVGLNSTERAYTAIHSIRKNINTNNLVISFFGDGNINYPAGVAFNINKTTNTIECTVVNGAASTYNYVTIIRYRF